MESTTIFFLLFLVVVAALIIFLRNWDELGQIGHMQSCLTALFIFIFVFVVLPSCLLMCISNNQRPVVDIEDAPIIEEVSPTDTIPQTTVDTAAAYIQK